jgi:ATP-dependent protease HslVU (ClpYQ) peptidase subunit
MTTIIATQTDDGVLMVADSQINSSGKPYFHSDMVKIIERNRFLIGVAGRVIALQTIMHSWNPPPIASNYKESVYHYMVTKIVPSLKSFIDESKIFTEKEKEEGDLFSILIATKGQLFEIDEDYSVARREDGIYAIGSGSDFALGALLSGAQVGDAMRIAASLDVNTHEPFVSIFQYA